MILSPQKVPEKRHHLWRSTPWNKMGFEQITEASPALLLLEQRDSSIEGQEQYGHIGVANKPLPSHETVAGQAKGIDSEVEFMRSNLWHVADSVEDAQQHIIRIDGTVRQTNLEIRCNSESTICHLHLEVTGDANLVIRISGKAKWVGLHLSGRLGKNTHFGLGLVNDLAFDSTFIHCDDWELARDSSLDYGALSLGSKLVKSDSRTSLLGKGAQLRQGVAVHGQLDRHSDHHIEIEHAVEHTDSTLVVNSALDDRSKGIATGKLQLAKNSNSCDAGQVFHNVLLGERAKAEAIPELEVLCDDVKAAHGAACGGLNTEQMHYLQSRGLRPEEAEAMLVEGFLMDAFSNLQQRDIIEVLRTRLVLHLTCEHLG